MSTPTDGAGAGVGDGPHGGIPPDRSAEGTSTGSGSDPATAWDQRTDIAPEARTLLQAHAMEPIPQEGAWFAPGPRNAALNTITALLADTPDGFSALHRLDIDEGWIWLAGAPIRMLRLLPDGSAAHDVLDATHRSVLVERGQWQGAATTGAWSLFACWCAPAFEAHHFRLGERAELIARHPDLEPQIRALTREAGTEPGGARTP